MPGWTKVEEARAGGPTTLVGRSAESRAEWEAARAADAEDLNRLLETGGEVTAYVAPLWSNADAERCLGELRGFDEARVYVVPIPGEGWDEAVAVVAESEWAGLCGEGLQTLGPLIHAAASLDVPLLLLDVDPAIAERALALAISEDLTTREIEAVLRGERPGEPDAESRERARDLLSLDR